VIENKGDFLWLGRRDSAERSEGIPLLRDAAERSEGFEPSRAGPPTLQEVRCSFGAQGGDADLKGFAPIPGEPQARRDVTEDVRPSRLNERERVKLAGTQGFEPQ
jgi:hypothetical protein